MGKNLVAEFITIKFMANVQSVLDQALQGKETATFQFPLMTKFGSHLEVVLDAKTSHNEQENIIGVLGIGRTSPDTVIGHGIVAGNTSC
jgi:hypothetical protein